MKAPSPEDAAHEAIRHWSHLRQLAEFAARRHGFANTDSGCGVTYPGDLDEHDRSVENILIPDGYVKVCGFWGPPDGYELLVNESVYLNALAAALSVAGHSVEAARIQSLAISAHQNR